MLTHSYSTHLEWTGSTAGGIRAYSRAHTAVTDPPTQQLDLTADKAFRGDPALLNPEQLLVMAASSCQLLSFLAVAARAGVTVLGYTDDAQGWMDMADKPERVGRIRLAPVIEVAEGTDPDERPYGAPGPRRVLHRQLADLGDGARRDGGRPMRWLELVSHEVDVITGVVRTLSPEQLALPVAACPRWTVQDLVVHIGEIERWVVHAVREGELLKELPTWPGEDLAGWYAAGAADLLAALDADPATPAASFAPDKTVGFWQRRQVHEHRIHRWDLEDALGAAEPIEPHVAADGVDEIATMFWPRQLRLGRAIEPDAGLRVVTTDVPGGWEFGPAPVATLSGPASDVLLTLMHRLGPDHPTLTWSGDAEQGRSVLGLALAP